MTGWGKSPLKCLIVGSYKSPVPILSTKIQCWVIIEVLTPDPEKLKTRILGSIPKKMLRDSVKIPDDMDALDVKAPPENIWITWVGNHVGNIWWFEARAFWAFLIFLHSLGQIFVDLPQMKGCDAFETSFRPGYQTGTRYIR